MKNSIYFLAVAMVLLAACSKNQQEDGASDNSDAGIVYSYNNEDSLQLAVERAERSPIIETKLFLGFQFGTTESEVDKHFASLRKEGKIYLGGIGGNTYQYDFVDEYGMEYTLTFKPFYYDGKLYKMHYPISSELGTVMLALSFNETREGFQGFNTEDTLGDDDKIYTFIKDNLVVTFKNTFEPTMIYENAPVAKMQQDAADRTNKEKAAKSSSEF